MKRISGKSLTFLKTLEQNNNKVWFTEHKDEFQAAMEEFKNFMFVLARVIHELRRESGQVA